ncbi:hypothetical protein K474DRAFT_1657619 [Panus rudis PR-1116 ss-1]|nr:hypothetical protein K474DRAFT_1657619 [Panus rudis PR-1116 ss-1]
MCVPAAPPSPPVTSSAGSRPPPDDSDPDEPGPPKKKRRRQALSCTGTPSAPKTGFVLRCRADTPSFRQLILLLPLFPSSIIALARMQASQDQVR